MSQTKGEDLRGSRAEGRLERFRALLPWGSLILGIVTGVIMDRSPERAPLVAVAAGVGWFAISGILIGGKLVAERLERRRQLAHKLADFSHFVGMQSLTQLCVFFSLPFYARAASLTLGHAIFLVLLGAVGAVSLWDPLYEAVLKRPVTRAPVQAFATFAGLNCVLPVIGLSNRSSLYVAAAWTFLSSPLLAALGRRSQDAKGRTRLLQAGAAALIPGLLLIGASAAIPPAPLRLTEKGIGSTVTDRALVDPTETFEGAPEALVCFSAIAAPRGLRDELIHVWRQNGAVRDRIPLEVVGGRDAGYRTWSKKRNLGADPFGKWTCTVETTTGQVVGRARARIASSAEPPG